MIVDVYFTSVYSNPSVFDTGSVAKSSNSKRELQNKQRLVKGEVTMCLGNDPRLIRSPSHTPSSFRISVEPKRMLFAVCVKHEYDLIMFIAIRLFM